MIATSLFITTVVVTATVVMLVALAPAAKFVLPLLLVLNPLVAVELPASVLVGVQSAEPWASQSCPLQGLLPLLGQVLAQGQ